MKNRSYANRGKAFEDLIKYANVRYERQKIALIQKVPTEFIPIRNIRGQVCGVKVEHKSTVDFIGRYKQYPIAIEAKNTNSGAIRFDEVQPHQADYMDRFTAQPGTIGMILVSFSLDTFYAIPWAFWGAAYDIRVRKGTRSASKRVYAFGEEWDVPTKKSARMEDLSPTWRISDNNNMIHLNYLKNAEKYVIPV